jgi:predicted  nucleic acid-binding Zn-ribbon protein
MEVKKYRLNSEITEYGQVNNGFAKVKILVNTYEQVANGTKFSKELLDSKMSKLNYLPVVGEFKEDVEDFGTHGGKLEISDDGFNLIDTTKPYGVVIENSGRWEKVKQKNGEEVDYVVCDSYLWVERYPELNVLYEGKENNQSMEINVTSGHWGEDNIFYVDDFEYSALCILGKKIMPAFEHAKVEVNFESQDFKLKYNEMLEALDRYLANSNTDEKEVFEMEGETKAIEEIKENQEFENKEEKIERENITEEKFEEETPEVETVDYEKIIEELKTQISEYEVSTQTLNSNLEKLQNDFNELNEKYTKLLTDNQELTKFKSDRLEEIRAEQEFELFTKFSKLDGDEEYEAIKSNAKNYSIVDLEKEIALIFVRKNVPTNYSSKQKEKATLKVELDFNKEDKKQSPYGDVFEKYKK